LRIVSDQARIWDSRNAPWVRGLHELQVCVAAGTRSDVMASAESTDREDVVYIFVQVIKDTTPKKCSKTD